MEQNPEQFLRIRLNLDIEAVCSPRILLPFAIFSVDNEFIVTTSRPGISSVFCRLGLSRVALSLQQVQRLKRSVPTLPVTDFDKASQRALAGWACNLNPAATPQQVRRQHTKYSQASHADCCCQATGERHRHPTRSPDHQPCKMQMSQRWNKRKAFLGAFLRRAILVHAPTGNANSRGRDTDTTRVVSSIKGKRKRYAGVSGQGLPKVYTTLTSNTIYAWLEW